MTVTYCRSSTWLQQQQQQQQRTGVWSRQAAQCWGLCPHTVGLLWLWHTTRYITVPLYGPLATAICHSSPEVVRDSPPHSLPPSLNTHAALHTAHTPKVTQHQLCISGGRRESLSHSQFGRTAREREWESERVSADIRRGDAHKSDCERSSGWPACGNHHMTGQSAECCCASRSHKWYQATKSSLVRKLLSTERTVRNCKSEVAPIRRKEATSQCDTNQLIWSADVALLRH